MNILVATGRVLIAIAALAVILSATIGGGLAAEQAHTDFLIGALIGAIGGLILAGTLFGAIAALFQIADNTAKTVRLLEKLEARSTRP